MRKTFLLLTLLPLAASAQADAITDGISIAGDQVYSYTPYVQTLGYVLAAIIGLVGAFSIYLGYINNAPDIRKRVLMWGGGSLAMLCMTIGLPQFFNYQESGLLADASSSMTTGGSGSQAGGDTYSTIDTSIPGMGDSRWTNDERYIPVTVGKRVYNVAYVLDQIYDRAGGGIEGSYGRTLSYLTQLYRQGSIDQSTYDLLRGYAGNLPHV